MQLDYLNMFIRMQNKILHSLAVVALTVVSFSSSATDDEDNESSSYRLDTGDMILIKVFEEEELTVQTTLNDRGVINYSFLGELQISEQTTREVELLLTERLKDGYLKNPSVSVSVLEYRPFFITGEVRTPGDYPFQPGLTLEKAVSIAGGFTDRASRRKIYLQRGVEQGKKRIRFQDRVQPGDIITVEEGFF